MAEHGGGYLCGMQWPQYVNTPLVSGCSRSAGDTIQARRGGGGLSDHRIPGTQLHVQFQPGSERTRDGRHFILFLAEKKDIFLAAGVKGPSPDPGRLQ